MLNLQLDLSAQKFAKQVEDLSSLVNVKICSDGILLSAVQGNDGLTVTKEGNTASITYQKQCEFFRGILTLMENEDKANFSIHEKAEFAFNGEFLDNSRNAVLTIETVKKMIMYSALLGLDNIFLYNEDTFEIPEDPYFGYFRMPYTREDVKILNDYASGFGIRIIPCIQTLAHLNQTLHWQAHSNIRDFADTLLVEEEKTYELIENTLKSWRECVDTDVIHIGMDEAYFLGRGKYMDKHGFKPRFELMCEHLKKVLELCKKYNFKAMMWSDMFFRLLFGDGDDNAGYYSDHKIDPELLNMIPKDVILIYWDYYTTSEEKYDKQFKKHIELGNDIMFGGGTWKWRGWVPAINHSHNVTKLALTAARKNGVNSVFTTAWGDDGAEASVFNIIPGLCLFAEESYAEDNIDERVSSKLKALTNYTLEEYFELCQPDMTSTKNMVPATNPTKYLLFQDILMGMFDYHVAPDFPQFYADCAKKIHELAKRDSKVNYIFETIACLCDVIALKSDVGIKLKLAYDKGDKSAMEIIANKTLPEISERIEVFYRTFKSQWYRENRTGGFDTQDLRFGGLKQRILTAEEMINDYVSGKIDRIRELEVKRLPYDGIFGDDREDINTNFNGWRMIATTNIL